MRIRQIAVLVAAIATGIAAGTTGSGIAVEHALQSLRFELRDRPASGELHLIEIDARSIAAIDRWPWPRGEHARVIERLRSAGAAQIAFDVDFSSRSDTAGDAALADALRRADGAVVLPTLRQQASTGSGDFIDLLPAASLRDHAMLAAVSMGPDRDGQVREAPLGVVTAGVPRPSLSAMIADRAGAAGIHFPIDYAIDPATIPRHSFIDVRDDRVAPASFAGKRVLIGATAVEMGDRYAVPRFGVIPGVVVQALAAETLRTAVPDRIGWEWPAIVAALMSLAILRMRSRATLLAAAIAAPLLLFGAAMLLEEALALYPAIVPGLAVSFIATLGTVALRGLAALHHRRAHDGATGMPNRIALLQQAHAAPARIAAARLVDFDKLAAGLTQEQLAQMVCRVGDRLALASAGHAIHRVEDRVLAWMTGGASDELDQRFESLRIAMLAPIEVEGRRVDVTLAFGAADDDGGDVARALANAALAADRAATAGDGWQYHAEASADGMDRDLSLLGELDEAVARGEIEVLYQPKLDLVTDSIASVEALVRWRHPTRGYLRPDLFIPLAERGGRIAGLTLAVIDRTVADLKIWAAAGHPITGAVNLSAKLVASADFMAALRARIAAAGITPAMLTLEVTESAAMTDPAGAAAALGAFRDMGVRISMDDYGTGQSTLSYLKQLPLDELKIDRSFVQYAHQNRGDAVLVRSTVELAHELGLKVVAEGVEDEPCLSYLRTIGCDMAQGYLISRPIGADALLHMLATDRRRAA